MYPAKPKVGIRASRSNEIWHLDVTILRLLDRTRLALAYGTQNAADGKKKLAK